MKNDFVKSRIKRIMLGIIDIFALFLCKMISLFIKNKNHWVLVERGYEARDNAYSFYKYLKTYHPEQKIYFVINKNSADYEKVKEDAVDLGSYKNYWVISTAEKLISTHYGTGTPSFIREVFILCGLHKKVYFLQHGIIVNNMPYLHFQKAPMQLFICGAKPEFEYIKNNLGHPEGVVQYTGLARFDGLHTISINSHQLLVMPTWRHYIKSREQFLQSDYYKRWQELITNKDLLRLLEQNDMTLIFYVHYEMQKYIDCFSSDSDHVIIAEFSKYDVQSLLKESVALITDYSSVFFDFAYMKKPLIYYQFDEDQFFANHYQKGYFDYRKNGFGEVCIEADKVIDRLSYYARNKCQVEDKYLLRIENFYPLYDTNNCKRIYDAIISSPKNKQVLK